MAKPKDDTIDVVIAATTFHGPDNVAVVEGALYDAAHPIVKAHPTMFRPVADVAIRA